MAPVTGLYVLLISLTLLLLTYAIKEEQWLYSTLALAAMGVHFNYNSIL